MKVTKKAEGVWWMIGALFYYANTLLFDITIDPDFLVVMIWFVFLRASRW